MADDYIRGQMDVSEHKRTFDGVMNVSTYAALVTGVVVIYLTLVFANSGDWLVSLFISLVVGAVAGFFTKRGTLYWTTLGVLTVITLISGVIVSAFAG
ncbi:MAG: aa3-type cytochrome c oxidase subunit IV [Oceanicaulis sp.]